MNNKATIVVDCDEDTITVQSDEDLRVNSQVKTKKAVLVAALLTAQAHSLMDMSEEDLMKAHLQQIGLSGIHTKRDFMMHPKVAEMRAKVWTHNDAKNTSIPCKVRDGVVAEYPTALMAMAAAAELHEVVKVPLMVAYGPGNRHGQYTMFIVSPFEFFSLGAMDYWDCYPSHRDMIEFLEKHGLCPW